jgi:hypothetical protein
MHNKKWRNAVSLFNLPYLITHMGYLGSQGKPNVRINYFMLDWSMYTLFVLNRDWKRESLQIMVFEYVCLTWSIVELKTSFETWIKRNDVKGVSLFHHSYLLTLMAYLSLQRKPNVHNMYFMFDCSIYRLFVLKRGWKHDSHQIMIFVYVCSTWSIVELKTRLETLTTRNDLNGVSLFNFSYLITLTAYRRPQRTPNVKIKYFMLD